MPGRKPSASGTVARKKRPADPKKKPAPLTRTYHGASSYVLDFVLSFAQSEHLGRPRPLSHALAASSPTARLGVEAGPNGLLFCGPRGTRFSVRVGLTSASDYRLPTAGGSGAAAVPAEWWCDALGYHQTPVAVRELSVRACAFPAEIAWWVAWCGTRDPLPLTVRLDMVPGPAVLAPADAYGAGLIALTVAAPHGAEAFDFSANSAALQRLESAVLSSGTVRRFPHLPVLSCCPRLRTLVLEMEDLRPWDLGWIARCPSLRVLTLFRCLLIDSLGPLTAAPLLEALSVGACDLRDVQALADMPRLRAVSIFFATQIKSLDGLGRCASLEALDVSEARRLTSLEGLRGAITLRRLSLRTLPITGADALGGCTALEELTLGDCGGLSRLPDLSRARCLRELHAGGSGLADLGGLAGCAALHTLDAALCPSLGTLSGLQQVRGLERLNVSSTPVRDLAPLAGVPWLLSLYARSCDRLRTPLGLQGHASLCVLDLTGSAVEDLAGLGQCAALRELRADSCHALATVDGLRGAAALHTLSLRGAPVPDLDALSDCRQLETVDCQQCRHLTSVTGLAGLRRLRRLDVRVCWRLKGTEALATCPMLGAAGILSNARPERNLPPSPED